jgi:predicted aspartyl protease
MTQETQFAVRQPLILVRGAIEGPRGTAALRLVLDTGASQTVVVPEILDTIGYSPRHGGVTSTTSTAIGRERGYTLRVARFAALGFGMKRFVVHVFDLEDRHHIDGLIGLSFLHHFNYEIRSAEGRIVLENISPLAA